MSIITVIALSNHCVNVEWIEERPAANPDNNRLFAVTPYPMISWNTHQAIIIRSSWFPLAEVFISVCLLVCWQHYTKAKGKIKIQLGGRMWYESGNNSFYFGADRDKRADPGTVLSFLLTLREMVFFHTCRGLVSMNRWNSVPLCSSSSFCLKLTCL